MSPDQEDRLVNRILECLHGVGEYTARSVLAHAYGKDTSAVDTNVERVLFHTFQSEIETESSADDLQSMTERLVPEASSSNFTHALIDLGGQVCTATDPSCAECVVRELCDYYERTD